jgi:hypothetical protein
MGTSRCAPGTSGASARSRLSETPARLQATLKQKTQALSGQQHAGIIVSERPSAEVPVEFDQQ